MAPESTVQTHMMNCCPREGERRLAGLQTTASSAIASDITPKRKCTLRDVAEAHERSKRYCDNPPCPLLSDPVNYPGQSVVLQTPRPNADLFAAQTAFVAAVFPKSGQAVPAKATFKATASLLASNPAPASAVVKKPCVVPVPEWIRTTTATKPRISAEALAQGSRKRARPG